MSFSGDLSFYNLSEGGLVDRVLPILVCMVACNEIQVRIALNRIAEVDANVGINTVCIHRLENACERAARDHESLLQELVVNRSEVIQHRVRLRVYERCLLDNEHQLADLRVRPRCSSR